MNWKIWDWPRQLREERKRCEEWRQRAVQAKSEYVEALDRLEVCQEEKIEAEDKLHQEITQAMRAAQRVGEVEREYVDVKESRDVLLRELEERMAEQTRSGALLHRLKDSPMDRPAILAVLAEVTDGTQWWRAVLTLIEEEAQAETTGALAPDLSNDLRNVRAGRAAALLDLKDRLVQKWAALQKPG